MLYKKTDLIVPGQCIHLYVINVKTVSFLILHKSVTEGRY